MSPLQRKIQPEANSREFEDGVHDAMLGEMRLQKRKSSGHPATVTCRCQPQYTA